MLVRFERSDFEDIHEILESNFPCDERRDREGQSDIFERAEYKVLGIREDAVLHGENCENGALEKAKACAAIMAIWEFSDFVYLEHFAVKEAFRNQGYGMKMLNELMSSVSKPIVLEVEPPEDDLTKRRIAFYERNGFVLNHYEYVQLAYTEQGNPVPLKIMSFPNALCEGDFINVRNTIYRELFGVICTHELVPGEGY